MVAKEIAHSLTPEDQQILADILLLYEDIDRQTLNFARQTGLHCKPSCGACCENPNIETTLPEVLPLAVYLWSRSQAKHTLEIIQSNKSGGICVFYHPFADAKGQGGCRVYAYRPGLCRLFGFSMRCDKHGEPLLMTCKIIKESQAHAYCQAQQLHHGAPLLSDHFLRVFNIDPVGGQKFLWINQAVGLALEKVGFYMALEKMKQ